VVLLTENGDWPAGACSDSGIPVLSFKTAVAFSVFVFPRRKFPPFAASAKPAAPMSSAIETATVAGQSPFSVNSTTQVNRLNAQYVGGEDAAQLQSTGGAGTTGPGAAIGLSDAYADVASTGPLPAGVYYVSATALIYTNETGPAYCVISSSPYAYGGGGGGAEASAQAAETAVATVAANTVLSERCAGYGNHQIVDNAEIIAIRIDSSSVGTKPLGKFKRFPPERTRGFASATHLGPAQ
jgi:hypothetical protein